MRSEDLPKRWIMFLSVTGIRLPLSAEFFDDSGTVTVKSEDGCTLKFKYAKMLQSSEEMLVLTEHFGYHIFPIDMLESWGMK
jgi:hypothetical protein